MRLSLARLLLTWLCAGALASPMLVAAEPLPDGAGSFIFSDEVAAPGQPLTVWYYKPPALDPAARIVFVMHGVDRNAQRYRDRWIGHAREHGFLLVVPEFTQAAFLTAAYQFGNVADPRRERWSFVLVEHLFDAVCERGAMAATGYRLYGHSAGAQFVHRLVLFQPGARAEVAVAANAGAYTLTRYDGTPHSPRPLSLDRQRVSEPQLAAAFARRLVLLLGEEDLAEEGGHVPVSDGARAQGRNRFERGQSFFAEARQQAEAQHAPFRWRLVTVPGVGHSDAGMSHAALASLLEP